MNLENRIDLHAPCACTGPKCVLLEADRHHGTIGGYTNHRCRCTLCRAANAATMRLYLQRHPEQREKARARDRVRRGGPATRPPSPPHGTLEGYLAHRRGHFGGRDRTACELCQQAYDLNEQLKALAKRSRPLSPCGTWGAYRRHLRNEGKPVSCRTCLDFVTMRGRKESSARDQKERDDRWIEKQTERLARMGL